MFGFQIYDLMYYVLLLPGAFFAPVIHESVKALCSTRLGDPTPKNKGLMRGNPFKYFEPIGFFLILLSGYGWGQPTPTSPLYYKNRRRGIMITYITPSVVNLLVGVIAAALSSVINATLSHLYVGSEPSAWFAPVQIAGYVLYLFAKCNVGLAFFNIIPIYPLDGAKILQLFLTPEWAVRMTQYEKILQLILLILLGLGLANGLLDPLTDLVIRLASPQ